jgi:hypothetical protein
VSLETGFTNDIYIYMYIENTFYIEEVVINYKTTIKAIHYYKKEVVVNRAIKRFTNSVT